MSPRSLWPLEPGIRHLNHGAFGGCPTPLLAAQQAWRDRMERHPARFFLDDMPFLLRHAAEALARFVGTAPDRLGFVENATAAINAVLASAPFAEGDEVVVTDHVYGAVRQTLRHHAVRRGARIVEAAVGMPLPGAAQITEAVLACIGPRTRLIVLDHIASPSAAIFPVAEIVAEARARGVPVLIDGAHAPGLIDLDIDAIGAAFYVGNCHKWLCSPKGAGFLAVAPDAPWEVHPTVISHAYGGGFAAEFDKTGTRDVSAWLTIPDAIALHERLGGSALRARNAALAWRVADALARDLGTETGAPRDAFAGMATVRLPTTLPPDWATARLVRTALWDAARIEAPAMAVGGALWLRLSAAPYLEDTDFDGLAEAVRAALSRLQQPGETS